MAARNRIARAVGKVRWQKAASPTERRQQNEVRSNKQHTGPRRSQRLRCLTTRPDTTSNTEHVAYDELHSHNDTRHIASPSTIMHNTMHVQAASGSTSSVIAVDARCDANEADPAHWAAAAALPTSPTSMSPSSLFDYEAEDEMDNGSAHIRGWISETTRHLQSSEMPSSRSPKKASAPSVVAFRMMGERMQRDALSVLNSSSNAKTVTIGGSPEADEDDESRLPASPTVERIMVQHRKLAARRVQSLPSRSMPWLASAATSSSGSSGGSHGGLLSSGRLGAENDGVTSSKGKRPATPPSVRRSGSGGYGVWPTSRSSGVKLPERPQSDMKHRSANEYSSGKNAPLIVVSSGSMPRSCGDEDDEQWNESVRASGTSTSRKRTADSDGLSPSPPAPPPLVKRGKYTLHSRASLPKSSFYQRTKQEEGSPTPSDRRRRFAPFAF